MIQPYTHEMIQALYEKGQSIREISRSLKISRNTVRRSLRKPIPTHNKEREHPRLDLIRRLFQECKGNLVRVQELLETQHGVKIGYSTLTRIVREAHLRKPRERVGHWQHGPGEEMEHDTSPHHLLLGDRRIKAQCAALILAYSKRCYLQYYPRFTRFEAKCFLAGALAFFGGACSRCVIDNSSVILAAGSGEDAVIAPEMESFARAYDFCFWAHPIRRPQRKPDVERLFRYAEGNFLCARSFRDWDDLNEQALKWCREIANNKEKRSLGMSPDAAFLMERSHLRALPLHPPPVYQSLFRVVDVHGYVNLDTNRYSVPDRLIAKRVEVHKHLNRVCIYFNGEKIADHPRLLGQRDKMVTDKKHHRPLSSKRKTCSVCPEEGLLRGKHPDLDTYLTNLKRRVKGRGQYYFRRLLEMKRTYPDAAFFTGLGQALHYGLFDLTRLENLILSHIAGDFFDLDLGGDEPCV